MTGYYRFGIGSFACTSLLDGSHEYTWQETFSNAPEQEVRAAIASKGMPGDRLFTPYTYLHVDTGEHQILVDTGAGSFFPTTGLLPKSMAAAEIDRVEIDTVIITHAHPDHIGGLLLPDGSPAFPNATHYICKREWDFWFSDVERSRVRESSKGAFDVFFDVARRHLQPVERLARMVEFSGEIAEIFPGVRVVRAPGHTPGHMVVELRSSGEKLLYIADTVVSPIHLEQPTWGLPYDLDPGQASVSKRFICDMAASDDAWVIGQHFPPFPSLGHIARRPVGWEWKPIRLEET